MKTTIALKTTLTHYFLQRKWLILINLIWLVIYLSVLHQYSWAVEAIAFSTPDSKSYLQVGEYFLGGKATNSTLYRPFLYPVILKLLLVPGKIYALLVFQAILWLLTLNLLFYSCKEVFQNSILAATIATIFGLNISFMVLTMHALTEVVATFGLSAYVFFVVKNRSQGLTEKFLLGCLMIFSLLTVVKPLYCLMIPPVLGAILYKWKDFQYKRMMPKVFIILIPVFIQLGVVFFLHDEITISKIGHSTIRTNFIANGYATMHGHKLHEAQVQINKFSDDEIYRLLSNNKLHFVKSYFQNLGEHLNGHPSYVNIPKNMPALSVFMARYNRITFWAHLFFSPVLLVYFLTKFYRSDLLLVFSLSLPWLLIALTSGISINQGDRLVLPGLPLCFVLYPILIYSFLRRPPFPTVCPSIFHRKFFWFLF